MIREIEKLIYEHFTTIPFHNLNLIYGQPAQTPIPGGTCSDKTLAFLRDARELGVEAYLHSALIGGKEIHRLVRVVVDGQEMFADLGNGWPALKLFPANESVAFECFGMRFRSEISDNWVRVFHQKQSKESLQLEINLIPRPEAEIHDQIHYRYSSGIEYPFSKSLRFSLIVSNEFLFLRGNCLERYSADGYSKKQLREQDILQTINSEFGFDISGYLVTKAW